VPILVGDQPPVEAPTEPTTEQVASTDYPAMFWTGWTGDSWQLAGDLRSLTMLTRDGRSGMIMPEVEHILVEAATSDGAYWQGYKTRVRQIGFPLFIWSNESPSAMRAEHERFLRTLQPDKTGTFTIAFPDGLRKSIQLRYLAGAEGSQDGGVYGLTWQKYLVQLIAADPYFYGDAVTQVFGNATAVNFYGGGTPGVSEGPPFYIGSSQTIASATLSNPGDRETWATYRIDGPFTSVTIVGGGTTLTLPITKTAGQWIQVNTDPSVGTIVDQAGANMWASAGTVRFAALPAFQSTELSITVVGADANTAVTVSFTPKYWRAW